MSSATYKVRDARINPGGGRQTGVQFEIPCSSIVPGQGRSSSASYVIQAGCGTLHKALLETPSSSPPSVFLALPSAPNPFVHSTGFAYQLPATASVKVDIFDALGRAVRKFPSQERAAGQHTFAWDGRDDTGRPTPIGLYLLRFSAGEHLLTRRVVKIK